MKKHGLPSFLMIFKFNYYFFIMQYFHYCECEDWPLMMITRQRNSWFIIRWFVYRWNLDFQWSMNFSFFFALLIQRIQNFIEKFFYLITSNCHHHWQEKAKVDIKVHKNKWIHFEFWESWLWWSSSSNERENDKLQNKPVSLTVCLFSPCVWW